MSEGMKKVNIPLFILSLLMSLFLWAIVYAQNTPVNQLILHPNLDEVGLDKSRFKIVAKPKDFSVEVVGTKTQLDKLSQLEVTARVDLKSPKEGRGLYQVYLDPSYARSLATNQNPTVEYVIEALADRKLPIIVTTTGQLRDPTHVYMDCVANPKMVTVTATRTDLLKVDSARVELDLSQVDANKPEPVNCQIFLYDENGQRLTDVGQVSPLTTDITPILSPSLIKKTVFLNVPFKGHPADGFVDTTFSVSPNQVSINGSPDVVNTLSQIDTDPVDLSGFDSDRTVEVKVRMPHGVSSVNPMQVKVKVSVKRSARTPADGQ